MAAPVTRVADYLAVLAKSQLLPADAVKTLGRGWKGSDADVDGLRRLLVNGKHLTEYQSVMVQRGHSDGFLIGGYIVQDRIGKGQSAGVYLGKHPSGQVVALKVLSSSKAKNPNVLGRFQREGRLLTALDHPECGEGVSDRIVPRRALHCHGASQRRNTGRCAGPPQAITHDGGLPARRTASRRPRSPAREPDDPPRR